VCIRKLRYSKTDAFQHAENLLKICEIFLIDEVTLRKSFDISINYQYSYYDSLIIAVALLSNCDILYPEDMQHQQTIDNQLQIINPFII
jgi:predicted nucleic acid-binding protein